MGWEYIISTLISLIAGGFIFQVIDRIRNKKNDKTIKDNEAKSSTEDVTQKQTDNDSAQIDLGKKFMESTLEMTQKMQDMMMASDKQRDEYWVKNEAAMNELRDDVAGIKDTVSQLVIDVAEIKEEQRSEIAYLNGDYAAFKKQLREKMEDENKRPSEKTDQKKPKTARMRYTPVPKRKPRKKKEETA